MVEPHFRYIGGREVESVLFQYQQTQLRVPEIVVDRHFRDMAGKVILNPLHVVVDDILFWMDRPIVLWWKRMFSQAREFFHVFNRPRFHGHAQRASRRSAKPSAAQAI